MNLAKKKSGIPSLFGQCQSYLLAIEIALFPWINFSNFLKTMFLVILGINVLISVSSGFIRGKFRSFTAIDILLGGIVVISVFNPGSYWMPFSAEFPPLRMAIFYIRYLTFPHNFFKNNSNLLFTMLLISSTCVLITWFFLDLPENAYRLYAPYGDPNYTGIIFGSYAILAMCWSINGKATKVSLMLILLCFFIVLLTASRGSILALVVATLFIFMKNYKLIIFAIAPMILLLQVEFITSLFTELYFLERILDPSGADVGAANSRFTEIEAALNNFGNNIPNMLFGNGLSSSALNFIGSEFRIHNTYVAIIYDQGIIGVILASVLGLGLLIKSKINGLLPLMIFMTINSMTIFILTFYPFYIFVKFIQEERI